MRPFEPTFGIIDSAKNTFKFLASNQDEFWKLVKYVAPALIACTILTNLFLHLFLDPSQIETFKSIETGTKNTEELKEFFKETQFLKLILIIAPIGLFMSYLLALFAISWHRLVLLGKDNYEHMKILKPKRHEFKYIFATIWMSILIMLITIPFMLISAILPTMLGIIGAILTLPIILFVPIYLLLRWCFYFPAAAADFDINLKKASILSKGYKLRLALCFLLCVVPVAFALSALKLILTSIAKLLPDSIETFSSIILMLPNTLIFEPLVIVIGVTVLSNYYQHALQNKGVPE